MPKTWVLELKAATTGVRLGYLASYSGESFSRTAPKKVPIEIDYSVVSQGHNDRVATDSSKVSRK